VKTLPAFGENLRVTDLHFGLRSSAVVSSRKAGESTIPIKKTAELRMAFDTDFPAPRLRVSA